MALRITDVERIALSVPFRKGCAPWMEVDRPELQRFDVFRVSTNESSIVGYGESFTRYGSRTVPPEAPRSLVGKKPVELALDDSLGNGLQMALLDILGQYLEVPVWQLLRSEPVHDACAISWWTGQLTPLSAYASEVGLAASLGYLSHKGKARPWVNAIDQVDAIKTAAPANYKIGLDWNGTLDTPRDAARVLLELDGAAGVDVYESPIPSDDVQGLATLRAQLTRPLVEHCRRGAYRPLLEQDAVDAFVFSDGGAAEILRQGAVAQEFGKVGWVQIMGNGLTTAFATHLACAMPAATLPIVTCQNIYADDLLAEGMPIDGGRIARPCRPGLGVRIDDATLEKYRVKHEPDQSSHRRLLVLQAPFEVEGRYCDVAQLRAACRARGWTTAPEGARLAIWTDDGGAEFARAFELASDASHSGRVSPDISRTRSGAAEPTGGETRK